MFDQDAVGQQAAQDVAEILPVGKQRLPSYLQRTLTSAYCRVRVKKSSMQSQQKQKTTDQMALNHPVITEM